MNSKGILAIPQTVATTTCMKCLKKFKEIIRIQIPEMGYGSRFDGMGTEIHLCEKCYEKSNPDIWNLQVIEEDYCEEYKNESQIFEYIDALPLQSKELIFNTYAYGFNTNYSIDQQDWIDFHLDELPHNQCKEYGFYSPEERKAYQEKFSTCQYPYNCIYPGDSKGCRCALHNHVSGEYGQKCGSNVSDECYLCNDYVKRVSDIKDVAAADFSDYEMYVKMASKKQTVESLRDKFMLH